MARILGESGDSDSAELRCNDVDRLRFWWGLFFRIFGLHQARNVQRHRASFFLSLVPEAAAHGPGHLLAGKPALAVATGAPCRQKLLARGEPPSALVVQP